MYKKIGKKIVRAYKRAKATRVRRKLALKERSEKLAKANVGWKRSMEMAEEKLDARINIIKKRNPSISKKGLKKELLKWDVRPSKRYTIPTMIGRGTSIRKRSLKSLKQLGLSKREAKKEVVSTHKMMRRFKRKK